MERNLLHLLIEPRMVWGKLKIQRIRPLVVLLILVSCGVSEDSENKPLEKLSDASWQMGDFIYKRGVSIQSTSRPNPQGPELRTFVISTSGPGNHGPFSGSSITGYLYEMGDGEYRVVSEDFFFEKGHTGKFITFNCSIGIGVSTGSTMYSTSNSQESVNVTIKDSEYVLTTEKEIILEKELDVHGGVTGAKNQYPFKAKSIF
ncbi:hypothetical protein [Algoriphagus confluentis]|uniref:Uncharacterized protein n=1 Tax=Algoriphagus confluentis TaxID=1697556 RepID=A0ABQ6PXQ2_9BACT|nr:hypothetical protein Aconfl_41670 [Algoriphagus confluentis]